MTDFKCRHGSMQLNIPEELRDWVKQFVDKDGNLDLERMDHGDAELLDYSRQPRKKGRS